jgi:hypothetical protein
VLAALRWGKNKVYVTERDKRTEVMDERQQKQVNEAAEKFAEAIKESYQALADRSVSAQELNAQLTQDFFNGVINNLRTQAESNRALAEDLIEQQRKQQEASQALTQESVNAYTDFLNSMFSYPWQGRQSAGQVTREVVPDSSAKSGEEESVTQDDAIRHPLNTWVEASPDDPSPLGSGKRAPREQPPPGEERPERRGESPATLPTPREEPPAGEERPGRRTP